MSFKTTEVCIWALQYFYMRLLLLFGEALSLLVAARGQLWLVPEDHCCFFQIRLEWPFAFASQAVGVCGLWVSYRGGGALCSGDSARGGWETQPEIIIGLLLPYWSSTLGQEVKEEQRAELFPTGQFGCRSDHREVLHELLNCTNKKTLLEG